MKSWLHCIFLILVIFPLGTLADNHIEPFTPLVGIPGVTVGAGFGAYVNSLYLVSISLAALLAVVKIIYAGVQWMFSDIVTEVGEAKKQIKSAVIGLLIVMSAVLILGTINPDLTIINALNDRDIAYVGQGVDLGAVDGGRAISSGTVQTIPCAGTDNCTEATAACNAQSSEELGFWEKVRNGTQVFIGNADKVSVRVPFPQLSADRNSINCALITVPFPIETNPTASDYQTKRASFSERCSAGGSYFSVREIILANGSSQLLCVPDRLPEVPTRETIPVVSNSVTGGGNQSADLNFVDGLLFRTANFTNREALTLDCSASGQPCRDFCQSVGATMGANDLCALSGESLTRARSSIIE